MIDFNNLDQYEKFQCLNSCYVGHIGPKGDKGDIGLTGSQGNIGPTGIQGGTGPTGLPGLQGEKGLQGNTGPAGLKGNTGVTGPQGNIGPTGLPGLQGEKGLQGNTGPEGLKGNTGATGPQGNIGAIGLQGAPGPTGLPGNIGLTGPQGETGEIGPRGQTGPTGLQGEIGIIGLEGPEGPIGPTGPSIVTYYATFTRNQGGTYNDGDMIIFPATLLASQITIDTTRTRITLINGGYYKISCGVNVLLVSGGNPRLEILANDIPLSTPIQINLSRPGLCKFDLIYFFDPGAVLSFRVTNGAISLTANFSGLTQYITFKSIK